MAGKSSKGSAAPHKNLYLYGGTLMVGVLVTGGAIFFGHADEGVIDVSQAIRNSNAAAQQSADENGTGETVVPVSDTRPSQPNGGLVGKGDVTPRPEPQVESASSTDESASSTDAATDSESDSEETTDESDFAASETSVEATADEDLVQ